jgi:hypothetical protein
MIVDSLTLKIFPWCVSREPASWAKKYVLMSFYFCDGDAKSVVLYRRN